MNDTIALTMIVRNEESNLATCLDSIQDYVDEIVIVDTGSTDKTIEIARLYTDKVHQYSWRNDFSNARNFALSKTSSSWILALDADEVLEITGDISLKTIISQNPLIDAYLLTLLNPTAHLTDEYNRFQVLRLFRNNGNYHYSGRIHEQILISNPQAVDLVAGVIIRHKMLSLRERNHKRARNLAILQKCVSVEPDNLFLQYYLGLEWLMLNKPAKALPYLSAAYRNISDEYPLFRTPALRYLIICLHALGKLDEAICLCLDASIRSPGYADICYLGGVLLEDKGEYRIAIKWFAEALDSGTPPPLYSHIMGSDGFLAHYHLGICYDLLGDKTKALKFYEKSLKENPLYPSPVYNLFMAALSEYGPSGSLRYFINLLSNREFSNAITLLTPTLAEMFFQKGYPDLAWQTLTCPTPEALPVCLHLDLGKYALFSGRITESQEILRKLPSHTPIYPQTLFFCSLGSILTGDFSIAHHHALLLWKIPAYRCHAFILLFLINRLRSSNSSPLSETAHTKTVTSTPSKQSGKMRFPEKIYGINTSLTAITIFKDCISFLPANEFRAYIQPQRDFDPNHRPISERSISESLHLVILGLEEIILTSPSGYHEFLEFYRREQEAWHGFLNYKFSIREGDALCKTFPW